MKRVDSTIRNATIISPLTIFKAGIAIEGGKIVSISKEANLPPSENTLDAKGLLVFPGIIDAHVHLSSAYRKMRRASDESETKSATFGGVTSVIDFFNAYQEREGDEEMKITIERRIDEISSKVVVDFGMHIVISPMNARTRRKLIDQAFDCGITSFKILMAYKREGGMIRDDELFNAFQYIGRKGGVACVHAENGYLVDYFEEKFRKEGKTEPIYHARSRPNFVEEEAVISAITLARAAKVNLYIVHLSTREGLAAIINAKRMGQRVFAETCPQYLVPMEKVAEKIGHLCRCNPPMRSIEDVDALWAGVIDGKIDVIATDHGPHDREMKETAREFWSVPPGIPGVETLFPLIYSEAVVKRGLSPTLISRVMSATPAKIFGIHGKGRINVGFDADLIFVDPKMKKKIKSKDLHSEAHYTPFEDIVATGFPVLTMIRGEVICKDGEFYGKPGYGHYLFASKPHL